MPEFPRIGSIKHFNQEEKLNTLGGFSKKKKYTTIKVWGEINEVGFFPVTDIEYKAKIYHSLYNSVQSLI